MEQGRDLLKPGVQNCRTQNPVFGRRPQRATFYQTIRSLGPQREREFNLGAISNDFQVPSALPKQPLRRGVIQPWFLHMHALAITLALIYLPPVCKPRQTRFLRGNNPAKSKNYTTNLTLVRPDLLELHYHPRHHYRCAA